MNQESKLATYGLFTYHNKVYRELSAYSHMDKETVMGRYHLIAQLLDWVPEIFIQGEVMNSFTGEVLTLPLTRVGHTTLTLSLNENTDNWTIFNDNLPGLITTDQNLNFTVTFGLLVQESVTKNR